MTLLSITAIIGGLAIGESAKWMSNSSAKRKLLVLVGGALLTGAGVLGLAIRFGAI